MSLSDGQAAKASIFNSAFLSRLVNTSMVGRLSLANTDSGGSITNVQQSINDNKSKSDANEISISNQNNRIDNLENSITKNNLNATASPSANDDSDDDYAIGSVWINTSNNKRYWCADNSVGAAVWIIIGQPMYEVVNAIVLDMSVNSVDDSNYTELTNDTGSAPIRKIKCFYPDGDPAHIAIGASGSEVDSFILTPGGIDDEIGVNIPANSRLSIKLTSGGTVNNSGKLVMNLLGEV